MRTHFISAIIMIACAHQGISQEAWKNHYRSSELEINYSYADCHDNINNVHKRLVILQFVNLTGNKIAVSYDKQMWYGDRCTGCDRSPEHQFTVTLEPHQTMVGSCEDKKNKALYIVEKMLDVKSSALTRFELAGIKVSQVE